MNEGKGSGRIAAGVAVLSTTFALIASYAPLDRGELAWIALVPWLWFLMQASARAAFFASALIGAVHVAVSLSWLARLTPPGLAGLIVYLSLYFGVAGWAIRHVMRSGSRFEALGVASIWTALEYLRSVLFTGFPWLLLGHTQYRFPVVIQISDAGGVFAVGFVLVAVNAAIARFVTDVRRERAGFGTAARRCLPATLVVVVTLVYGVWRLAAPADEPGPKIAGIQANIGVSLKHESASQATILREHFLMSRDALERDEDIDLVVWSETMFPLTWDENEPILVEECVEIIRSMEFGVPFLTGITAIEEGPTDPTEPGYRQYNRALLFDRESRVVAHYDKMHLVPGGEIIPFGNWLPFRRSLERAFYELAGWYPTLSAGEQANVLELDTAAGRVPFGVIICYDSVFSRPARRLAENGARFLINISNDGWYGDSAELEQILAITAFRAVETRLPVFRSTNTGISAVTDSRGRIIERLRDKDGREKEVRGTLVARIGLGHGSTPYRVIGDLFSWGACAASVGILLAVFGALRKAHSADARTRE